MSKITLHQTIKSAGLSFIFATAIAFGPVFAAEKPSGKIQFETWM